MNRRDFLKGAGAVLAAFTDFFGSAGGGGERTLEAFRATFGCMALITLASAGIFWQLDATDSRMAAATKEQDVPDAG